MEQWIGLRRLAHSTAITTDGNLVAYSTFAADFDSDRYAQQLWIGDSRTGKIMPVAHERQAAYDPAWSPDGTKIAFSGFVNDGQGNLYREIQTMAADGAQRTPLTATTFPFTEGNHTPDWSPDGTRIVFAHEGFLAGDGIRIITADGSFEERPSVIGDDG